VQENAFPKHWKGHDTDYAILNGALFDPQVGAELSRGKLHRITKYPNVFIREHQPQFRTGTSIGIFGELLVSCLTNLSQFIALVDCFDFAGWHTLSEIG